MRIVAGLITADWVWPNDGASICPGHSLIYDPDGKEVARSLEGEEQLLVFEIPIDRLIQEKGRRVYGSPLLIQEMGKYY
ncbi:MAG: carbon-nitrogen hydrolase family protein [Chlamydiia bacterium]|nr:carbon-nitrogen hydrolase family protein [Chlamydiia bacterium]